MTWCAWRTPLGYQCTPRSTSFQSCYCIKRKTRNTSWLSARWHQEAGTVPAWDCTWLGLYLPETVPARDCTCLGLYLPGTVPAWDCTCVGLYLPGTAPAWDCTWLGLHLTGTVPAWDCTCLGLYLTGTVPAWDCTCLNPSVPLQWPHSSGEEKSLLLLLTDPGHPASHSTDGAAAFHPVSVRLILILSSRFTSILPNGVQTVCFHLTDGAFRPSWHHSSLPWDPTDSSLPHVPPLPPPLDLAVCVLAYN
jgi:hypothetical protein